MLPMGALARVEELGEWLDAADDLPLLFDLWRRLLCCLSARMPFCKQGE